MKEFVLTTDQLKEYIPDLSAGDRVLLSGMVYTARDAAHQKLVDLLQARQELPFLLSGAVLYYAGPTEAPPGRLIGSCGPTTAGRMDSLTIPLLEGGLCGMIGKGERNQDVMRAIRKHKAVYFCAIGGAGALAAKCITSCEVIAFPELGCESIKKLTLNRFPLLVGVDAKGCSIFAKR